MYSEIDVRALEGHEWRLWRAMRLRALADAPDSFRPTLNEERGHADSFWAEVVGSTASHPRGNLWLAWIHGAPVGMLFGRIDATFSRLEIGAMWVEAGSRRRGVGSELVAVAMEWAKSVEVASAWLWCRDEGDVKAFYTKLGFEPTGESEPLRRNSRLSVLRMQAHL